jgi:hypothetical protein
VPLEAIAPYSCKLTRDLLVGNIVIAFDGSWSHRRNSKEYIIVVLVVRTNRVFGYGVICRRRNGDSVNYSRSSIGMKCDTLAKIAERLKSD